MNNTNILVIETGRLRLRPLVQEDFDAIFALNSDPEVMRYITGGEPMPRDQVEARLQFYLDHWQRHGFGLFAIEDIDTGEFAGFCGLQYLDSTSEVEVGYRLAEKYWGKGIATESGRVSLQFGFDYLNLDRIVAVVHPENLASQRVIEKLGLRYEKRARYYNTDVIYYALNRDER